MGMTRCLPSLFRLLLEGRQGMLPAMYNHRESLTRC